MFVDCLISAFVSVSLRLRTNSYFLTTNEVVIMVVIMTWSCKYDDNDENFPLVLSSTREVEIHDSIVSLIDKKGNRIITPPNQCSMDN